jgi:uncharacterized protein (TIGR02270 family)
MSTLPLQRPIGFAPAEISVLVNEPVVSRHAEEAAFLWSQRARAVGEPHFSLKDLAALDERVEANVDGLRTAGDIAWTLAKGNLAMNAGAGEIFAMSVVAFSAGARARMTESLRAACGSSKTRSGLVSALGWLDHATVSESIAQLLDAKSALHRSIGIGACAIRRRDPGRALAAAVNDPDEVLRVRALRAVGELKRQDLSDDLQGHLAAKDAPTRFWAAWSLALNGDRDGLEALVRWLERSDEFTEPSMQVALRALSIEESRRWISYFAADPRKARLAVMGAGVVGDPASIPWLIRRMEVVELSRLAGEAFAMITGVDLAFQDLDQDPPATDADDPSIEEVIELNYESNLRWPSSQRVGQWWNENSHRFTAGTRHLAGKPIAVATASDVLVSGQQRQRAAAALELALLNRDQPLFEVRARGQRQQRELAAWTS